MKFGANCRQMLPAALLIGLVLLTNAQGQTIGSQPGAPESIPAVLRPQSLGDTAFDVQRYVEDYYHTFCIDTTGPDPVIDIWFKCDSLCLYQHPELGLTRISWMFGQGGADMPVRNIPKLHLIPCIVWWHPNQKLAYDEPIPLGRLFHMGDSSGSGSVKFSNPSGYPVRIRLTAFENSSVDFSVLHRLMVATEGSLVIENLTPGNDTTVVKLPVGLYTCETVELRRDDNASSSQPAKRCEQTIIERVEIRGGLVSNVVAVNTDPNAALFDKTDTVGVCRFQWLEQFEVPTFRKVPISK